MGKDSFVIYTSFYKPISKLSDKQLGRLFRAIFKFQLGEVVSVEEDIDMAFEFFKNQFEIDERKYRNTIERNTENGRKGGNPNFKKGQRNPYYKGNDEGSTEWVNTGNEQDKSLLKITKDNPTLSKITHNDNDNDNVNVNDNVNDKERVKEKVPDGTPFTPNEGKQKKTSQVDLFVEQFNAIRGTKFKPTDKVCRQFNARLKEGFTTEQMLDALKNAMQDDFHKGNGFKYLTPEFFTRSDKIDMFANRTIASETLSKNSLLDSLKQFKKERGMD